VSAVPFITTSRRCATRRNTAVLQQLDF